MTGPGSPQRPQGPLNRSKPPVPLAELVATLACAIDERSSRTAIHSSQSGVPSILRTSPATRSDMVGRFVMNAAIVRQIDKRKPLRNWPLGDIPLCGADGADPDIPRIQIAPACQSPPPRLHAKPCRTSSLLQWTA